jgi:hypothetical protein
MTENLSPTWEGVLPILLRLYTNPDARGEAYKQFEQMAKLADAFNASRNTFKPIGDAANRVVDNLSLGQS